MERSERLVKEVYQGVKSMARRYAKTQSQAEDFLQEGLLYAVMSMEKYQDKNDQELILIISRSAYNRISSLYRSLSTFNKYHTPENPLIEIQDPIDVAGEVEYKDFIRVLKSRLPKLAADVFGEKVSPSLKSIQLWDEEKNLKSERKSKGALVMNLESDKIPDSILAKSLGVSKATFSRNLAVASQEAKNMLSE